MTHLSIRNLTSKPLKLVRFERFDGSKESTGTTLGNVVGTVSSFLNATDFSRTKLVVKSDAKHEQDISIDLPAFETRETDIEVPNKPDNEVVRLQFEHEEKKYETDVPSPGKKSSELKSLDGGDLQITAVFVRGTGLITLLSSARLNQWMGKLADDISLTCLSIPGTHNSPTCYVALPSVRCQAVDVREQLANGVRFLDVRVSVDPDNDEMALVHSAFPISLTGHKYFHDMVESVHSFLEENPSETVIMSVKREGTGKGTDADLGKHLHNRHISTKSESWWTGSGIPTLGEARGKIILMSRFRPDQEHQDRCGIQAAPWPDNCEDALAAGGLVRVQDFYEVTESTNIEKKRELSCAHLERAAEHQGNSSHIFVNFLTASNFFNATCWPERIAAKLNPSIIEYLCGCHGITGKGPQNLDVGDGATGIVVTDWVGANGDWDLVLCIVGMNAKLVR
ncbi:1-phosphatidylinositol phosphodiesterase [Ceratocystis platani]|uniref:1-phosphatidylinositol phosphodiesterase n=1 Tax=Ceratocystis fimbriata f. sp. platani TaxID=88771 RepID=A0A0F8B7S1_CERFI|nr:1-phosphatidylinositol phosphodiesterase [Ceratocystis platani]